MIMSPLRSVKKYSVESIYMLGDFYFIASLVVFSVVSSDLVMKIGHNAILRSFIGLSSFELYSIVYASDLSKFLLVPCLTTMMPL